MSEYRLHGWAESGNTYKAALMLAACGADWEPVKVSPPECSTPEWRARMNETGEVPVLERGDLHVSQSAIILDYLAATFGKYGWSSEDERRAVQRWLFFDNHKLTAPCAYARFRRVILGIDDAIAAHHQDRFLASLGIMEKHFAENDWAALGRTTIADFSFAGYLFFDGEIGVDWADFPATKRWRDRLATLPNWKPPYDMLPRARG
jgi:glutathione S-transferase